MDVSTFATKGNLIKAKSDLELATMGYDLLDKKRNVLIAEMMSYIERAEKIQAKIDKIFSEAYRDLQAANIFLGINLAQRIGDAIPEEENVNIRFRSVMGVEIPVVGLEKSSTDGVFYSFSNTNHFFDRAFIKFNKVKEFLIEMAEIENTVYLLSVNIQKTQKRANALKSIIIPKYTDLVGNIGNILEDKEREETSRLHVIKQKSTQA
ncbi:MAG: V-type ATP synthase subunit D [Oscillospiraceae bacterium]|nr:V-type ATP synthase subunit D [Oscillospiraceae bacterium]